MLGLNRSLMIIINPRSESRHRQEWIEQQKRIHSDLEQHVKELSDSWAASQFEPTHAWVAQKDGDCGEKLW